MKSLQADKAATSQPKQISRIGREGRPLISA